MQYVKEFFTNYILMSAVFSWLTAQILKVFTGVFVQKKFTVIEFLFGPGGMPSSHTACVVALFVSCFVSYGPASPYIAITGVLSMIVIRDAVGVRREVGEQAKILNKIVAETWQDEFKRKLKEFVGHTPKQAFVGALVGIAVPLLTLLIPVFRPNIEWIHG